MKNLIQIGTLRGPYVQLRGKDTISFKAFFVDKWTDWKFCYFFIIYVFILNIILLILRVHYMKIKH